MKYKYLENIELTQALHTYLDTLEGAGTILECEEIPVKDSLGYITSEAVFANISSPHYNACAMDGIAVIAKSTFGATETTPVVLTEDKDFIRVDTGDPLPDRFDAVVMIEDVIENDAGTIKLISSAVPWQHVRQIGEDICASEMIVPSNTAITPAIIGAMLAGGVLKVKVRKKPVVGLIPTGDEIVPPTANPKKGDIIEFNSSIFSAMLTQWGAKSKIYDIVPDKLELIKDSVVKASKECDLVIINAGSSAGTEDYSSKAIEAIGRVITHGIAIRPGKPTILGVVNGKPVIGVPGYPVSGIIVLENIVRPVLERMVNHKQPEGKKVKAVLTRKIVSSLKYEEFIRMKLGFVDGRFNATPLNRGAGVVTSFAKADGLMRVPINSEGIEAGETVEINLLRSEEEIRNTLSIIGSHDPLIDVIEDQMRKRYQGEYISSAHVGSMGGIMAIKRGEAHIAGIHLLDEATGEYNKSYIEKYLGNEKVLVIRCVMRQQGLMVAPGNPKNIKSIADLKREGVRYVNRQKGAGTRILLDYLLKQEGIEPADIYGYDREEYTHMSVATLVASGSADAGMGIYSAAKTYGLDFKPICEEQYDFIMLERFQQLDIVKHFIEILKSNAFKTELMHMGGYNSDKSGEIIRGD